MLPAERLAWLESAVQFVADVNCKFYTHRLDSKKTERNKVHG
jgi:hypothetical protein